MIDAHAIVDPSAKIDPSASIGPFSVIGADVEIGPETWVGPHVVINGPTVIGARNKIFQFASVGEDPQHVNYRGESTRLVMGDDNIVRENATIHRGSTDSDDGVTRIGNKNFFMAYTHVAHDCVVGDEVILANSAGIAGHVQVGDGVVLGAFAGVHQFCRIGDYAFLGRATKVVKDILPYMMVAGNPGAPTGLNTVGLKRRGFSAASLKALRESFKLLYKRGLKLTEAVDSIMPLANEYVEVKVLLDAIAASERGIAR